MLSVLVPHRDGIVALSGLSGVRPLLYAPDAPLPDDADEAEIMVVQHFDKSAAAVFSCLPRLRVVQTLSADVEAWREHVPPGVGLSSARGAFGGPAAEWVVAALQCIVREFPRFAGSEAAHAWIYPGRTETLDGKRALILGAGDLATNLRQRLVSFGASVTMVARPARPGIHGVNELPELLGEHDAVVVAVPANSDTRHVVDRDFLAHLSDDSTIVNVARGSVVDTDVLLTELRALRLRAALDVTDPEPLPSDHPLRSAPNVLIAPHIAGLTARRAARVWAVVTDQIAAYAAGARPSNLVSSVPCTLFPVTAGASATR